MEEMSFWVVSYPHERLCCDHAMKNTQKNEKQNAIHKDIKDHLVQEEMWKHLDNTNVGGNLKSLLISRKTDESLLLTIRADKGVNVFSINVV